MLHSSLIPWLNPHMLIADAGPWALLVVCAIIFAETGLLVGFIFPGDTLLLITGLLSFGPHRLIHVDIWWVALAIGIAAFLGGQVGFLIGHAAGPRIFERKESGLFSITNVKRTNAFFDRFGALAVIVARFVPVVRTFAPVAAGVGHMETRRYTVYNLVGALVWGGGVTVVGYLLGNIKPVADFVAQYIDVVLLAVVGVTVVIAVVHYLQSAHKARKANAAAAAAGTPATLPTDSDVTLRQDELGGR